MDENMWIDVSATVSNRMVHWPTDPPTLVFKAEEIGVNDGIANVTAIHSSVHVGTHVDAPLHFFAEGHDIASIDINRLMGPARVIHITNEKEITLAEVQDAGIEQYDRVLFRTHNSDAEWETRPFNEAYVYLSEEVAAYLADREVQCVGVDYLSIGGNGSNPDVHRLLLRESIVIIEGLKLGNVSPGLYDMACLPVKIKDSDGAPARVVLRKRS
jgi:arylformamidase